jgi:adenine phosphoribosyltransferase
MQIDALAPQSRVAVVDDLIATGGSARAAGDLVAQLGGHVAKYLFVIELLELGGRRALPPNASVYALIQV